MFVFSSPWEVQIHAWLSSLLSPLMIFPVEDRPQWTLASLPLLLLPVPTLLLQAYLMFTPGASRLLRLALLPITVASIIPIGFSHHFYGENQYSDLNNLAGLYAIIFIGNALKLGLGEAPKWVGWEGVGDEKDVEIIKENPRLAVSPQNGHSSSTSSIASTTSSNGYGHVSHVSGHANGNGNRSELHQKVEDQGFDLTTVLGRIKIAGWFLLSPRNIGFSPGLAPSFFHPHPTSRPRREAILAHLKAVVQTYFTLELILLPFTFHRDFSTIGGSQYGSLYAPGKEGVYRYVPTLVASFGLTFCVGLSLQAVMTLIYHEIALFCVIVSPSETADLYWPPMFQDPTGAASLTELWGKRWHQLFRAPLGFCGYQLSHSLGLPRPVSLMATFFLSSFLHHVAISGQGFDEATHGVTWPLPLFFTMQGVGVVLEGVWKKFTGRRTGGRVGRYWVLIWVLFWGRGAMEVFVRRGQMEAMQRGALLLGRPLQFILRSVSERLGLGIY
ncbi:hypothetical protein BDY24DRAFT_403119 [Mrakia frigida]|uniref:wax synthase family protein n=1 Tax=Mrakia frigida TaxID=29902 RepID=UPI003FCBF4D6